VAPSGPTYDSSAPLSPPKPSRKTEKLDDKGHRLLVDWRQRPGDSFRHKTLFRKRRAYGEIRERLSDGELSYVALRRPDEMFFTPDDQWAFDIATIDALKLKPKIARIGVEVSNGDRYDTHIKAFIPKKYGGLELAVVRNYENHTGVAPGAKGKKGALQWYLRTVYFKSVLAPAPAASEIMVASMMLKSKSRVQARRGIIHY
jgi:hypothetical protein